jgi:penicillin amidase
MASGQDGSVTQELESLQEAAKAALSQTAGELRAPGLREPVEVLRDRWGVPHIYARNRHDLFFAQGYVQAQDRLWQMEVWRREAEGRLAELGGATYLERDKLARLIAYRDDMDAEWESYGPGTRQIAEAFAEGVNAYIDDCAANPPIEFQLMGVQPEKWTPEVCLGRTAGLYVSRNAAQEALRALLLAEVGPEETARLMLTSPDRDLSDLPDIAVGGLEDVVRLLGSLAVAIRLPYDDASDQSTVAQAAPAGAEGSNNWVISGKLSATGKPILANDPHRLITTPSLRYAVHLVCPASDDGGALDVIGGSEPAIPGVTIGHNDRIAWGITTINTDQQDLYVEEINPADATLYRAGDAWEPFRVEHHTFRVKGEAEPRQIDLKFTRHGPVIHEDKESHRAVALRWAGAEPGGAGYLASLAVDQARDWPTFLEAADRWKTPSSNIVYADIDGHIGWIAAALTPVRAKGKGLTPAPGADGEYDWQGWLPTGALPQVLDPDSGYVATANQNILPPGYERHIALDWSAPYRFERIDEVLSGRDRFGIEDFKALQHDVTSMPARRMQAMLRGVSDAGPGLAEVISMLLEWDAVLDTGSAPAALFKAWMAELVQSVIRTRVPERLWPLMATRPQTEVLLELLENPDSVEARDRALLDGLRAAVEALEQRFGSDRSTWRWGDLHRQHFRHTIAPAAAPAGGASAPGARETAVSSLLDLPSVPRSGDGDTPMATPGPGFDQTNGASYCQIIDLADWDRSVAKNTPGQSGQPMSPHYGDLVEPWSKGEYFPLAYSRQAVESVTEQRLLLVP